MNRFALVFAVFVMGCGEPGMLAGPELVVEGNFTPFGLAADANALYFTNGGGDGKGNVQKVALTGGAAAVVVETGKVPFDIALDSTSMTFTDRGSTGTDGAVWAVPKVGGLRFH